MEGVHAVLTPCSAGVIMSCFTRGKLIATQVVKVTAWRTDMDTLLKGYKPETTH
jgi:hypothetical protein